MRLFRDKIFLLGKGGTNMRFGLLSGGVFWGLFLIFIGVLYTLRSIFNLNIPVLRTIVALFIIYIGVSMLINSGSARRNTVIFDERNMSNTDSQEYNIIFGTGVVDLSKVNIDSDVRKEIDTVFASSTIRVDPDIPARIVVNSAFAWAQMPDGNGIAFGQYTYVTKSYVPGEKHLEVKADVVFGELKIVEQKTDKD
jgi:hypothetical protein